MFCCQFIKAALILVVTQSPTQHPAIFLKHCPTDLVNLCILGFNCEQIKKQVLEMLECK